MPASETVHASAALVGTRGVLIRGASGSGKSSLLLSLLFGNAGGVLVADDRVALSVRDGHLIAAVPDAIAGLLEVRGVGIIRRPYVSPAAVDLVADLVPLAECPRLPGEAKMRVALAGVMLPRIFIAAGAADGAMRVRAALASLEG